MKSGNSAVFTHIFQFIAEGDTFTPNSTRYIVTERAQRMWDDCPVSITHWPAALRPFHSPCGMWNFYLWKTWPRNFLHNWLWTAVEK